MAKGIEKSLIDDVLTDLTAEIMKEQKGARKKQEDGQKEIKKSSSRSERSALSTLGNCLVLML